MKTLLKMTFLALFCCHALGSSAQAFIEGKLENWEHTNAKIISINLFTGDMREFGKIDASGNIHIPLKEDFLTYIKAEMLEAQENAPKGATLSLKDVQGTFDCHSGELQYDNGAQNLSSLPRSFHVINEDGDVIGAVMPVSNPEIARWNISFGQESTAKGKYVEWVYLDEAATVNGACTSNVFVDDTTFKEISSFDLDFEEGWNLVQHEITETYEDKTGKLLPKKTNVTTIEQTPNDISWTFIPAEKK